MRIGVISDTHGLLRPEALALLDGSDHILHVGDLGSESILNDLEQLAPVTAIRGNIDRKGTCADLPATEVVELAGRLLYLVHSLTDLDLDPVAAGISAVLSGHSHQPSIAWKSGVLYLNPGSAGPRRFRLPITLARIDIEGAALTAEIVPINLSS